MQNKDKFYSEVYEIIEQIIDYLVLRYASYCYLSDDDIEDMKHDCFCSIYDKSSMFDPSRNIKLGSFLQKRIVGFYKDYLKIRKRNDINLDYSVNVSLITPYRSSQELGDEINLGSLLPPNFPNINLFDQIYVSVKTMTIVKYMMNECSSSISAQYAVLAYYFLGENVVDIKIDLGMTDKPNRSVRMLKYRLINKLKNELSEE